MAMPGGPQPADRILILKQPWLDLILQGTKTLEIRSRPLSAGSYWLGHKKVAGFSALFGPFGQGGAGESERPEHGG